MHDPQRFEGRNEPIVVDPIGDPPEWMGTHAANAWNTFAAEIPWLNASHRALLEIASTVRGRMMSGDEVGVQAMTLLKQCLSAMGATPGDASKVGAQPGGEQTDPADAYFK